MCSVRVFFFSNATSYNLPFFPSVERVNTEKKQEEEEEQAKPAPAAAAVPATANATSPLSLLDNLSTADILAAVSESTDEGIAMISSWFGLDVKKELAAADADDEESAAETGAKEGAEKNEASDSRK